MKKHAAIAALAAGLGYGAGSLGTTQAEPRRFDAKLPAIVCEELATTVETHTHGTIAERSYARVRWTSESRSDCEMLAKLVSK